MKEYRGLLERMKEAALELLTENDIAVGESEEITLEMLRSAGAEALGEYWTRKAAAQAANRSEKPRCGHCGHKMRIRRNYSRRLMSLLGPVRVTREYQWCAHGHGGHFWLDEQLGCRGREQTGKVQERIALSVAEAPYGEASRLLLELAGLKFAHCTLEEVAKDLGSELMARQEAARDRGMEDKVQESEEVATLCVSTDGVKVPTREGWQEARVVTAFPYQVSPGGSAPEAGRISYTARIENCEATGWRMYGEAKRRGLERAQRVVVIGDGADWIWNQADEHFPGATQIVDWYHATQHLWEVANTVFGQKDEQARRWEQAREAELWEGQVDTVIAEMRRLFYAGRRQRNFRGSEAEHVLQRNMGYFLNHHRRMDYARFRAQQLPIGSGAVESACKHFVAARCKRSGMRWGPKGIHAVLELRAALLSDEWHHVKNLLKAA